ncbi:MAG: bifunctional adenosylcobinamide kinase/adenosylcobinamide-phosphate guanylyltransferase [Gammaproteobacteria bacterium]|nr:bifunctional adenosylcobinamide kinase/adenosylcobinamide-phosphate guanylyltransferase [Gammaproteobacteria bacterium]
MRTLILGGVRSGKSRLAERLALESELPVTYIATAHAGDAEMAARIAGHVARRPADWRTVEAPYALAAAIRAEAEPGRCVLVDCLTLWLSNWLCGDADFSSEREALVEAVQSAPGTVILVANETGLGIVPMGELSRRFGDEAGVLHQRLASVCERVVFTVAGLPMVLRGSL